jgi:hypothetical protein
MPTLRSFGEGRTCGEAIDTRIHAIRRGSGHGTLEGSFTVTGGGPSWTRVAMEWRTKGIRTVAVSQGLFPTPGAWERLYPDKAHAADVGRLSRRDEFRLSDITLHGMVEFITKEIPERPHHY